MTKKEAIFELIKYRRRLEEDSPIDAEPFDMAIEALERKHGEWAEEGYCPFCKCDMPAFIEDWEWKRCRTPYCPNCGADMRERREDE